MLGRFSNSLSNQVLPGSLTFLDVDWHLKVVQFCLEQGDSGGFEP